MMFTPVGFAGYMIIGLALLSKTLGWITNSFLFAALIIAGFVCFGIVENRWGRRHWLVRYLDYTPLMVLVIAYVLAGSEVPQYVAIALLLPLGAASSYGAVRLARTKKYRTMPVIDEHKKEPPKFQ